MVASNDVKANYNKEASDDSPSLSKSNSSLDDDEPLNSKSKSLVEIYERCNFAIEEPTCYEEVAKEEGWIIAMNEEIKMIKNNGTWDLVPRPKERNVIGLKQVYRAKLNLDSSLNKLKARLVVKGYTQQLGVDYGDIVAPVVRHDIVQLLVVLAAQCK